ncbi:hypothetical protein YC2023_044007 [Brassica napus]
MGNWRQGRIRGKRREMESLKQFHGLFPLQDHDRSMKGCRYTEIAIGCNQTNTTNTNEILAYRLSLWYEHTAGQITEDELSLSEPECLDCVRGGKGPRCCLLF